MNLEEFEDDFEPIKGDFVIDDNDESEEDSDQIDESIDSEESKPTKIDKPKLKKVFKVLGISIIGIVAVLLIVNNSYFKNYKTNFITNIQMIDARFGISEAFGSIFGKNDGGLIKRKEESRAMGTTYDNESYIMPFENASQARYAVLDGKVISAKSNYIAQINEKGKEQWKLTTNVVNPILAVEGDYIALAENGGTKICLYSGDELIYAVDASNEILNANVSSRGDVVVVTKKDFYKGAVEVFNKKGEHVFSWSSGSHTVICADISPSGRRIAVGFLDDREGVKGIVQFFEIDEKESYKTVEIPGTAVFKLEYSGETLNLFGDNRMVGLSVHGSIIWDVAIDGQLSAYDIDSKGNKALVIDKNNLSSIKTYSKKGKLDEEFVADELPDYIDISKNILLYNNTRMIFFGKPGKEQKYAASMDVKGLRILDKNNYMIIYSNSLEFVKK